MPVSPTLRAAWWAVCSTRGIRRRVERDGLAAKGPPPPPPLPIAAGRGVSGALRLTSHNCLVQALVRQAWESAQGNPRDVVIGVTAPVRHMGPMAQDFAAGFELGDDERSIHMVDAAGVAIAAIQGLHGQLEEQRQELVRLRAEVTRLSQAIGIELAPEFVVTNA